MDTLPDVGDIVLVKKYSEHVYKAAVTVNQAIIALMRWLLNHVFFLF